MNKKIYITLWLIIGLALLLQASEGNGKRDTVRAAVVYGEEFLFPGYTDLSPKQAAKLRDSVLRLPSTTFEQLKLIDFYISLGDMTKGDVVNLIDSLFELDYAPLPLVNQLNLFLAHHQFPPDETNQEILDSALFNPDRYYGNVPEISTPFGYDLAIKQLDSNITLQLTGNEILQQYVSPLDKVVLTSPFGWREGRMHNGIDLDLEVWDEVKAAFPGVVRFAKYYGGYGRVVIIRHYNGLETLYAHLHRFKVKAGDVVNAGDIIGLGGSSGHSTGSHLHFEVRFKGFALNPRHLIDFNQKQLITEKLLLIKTPQGFSALPDGINFHTVKKGDTLFEIAKYYGTTLGKLCELNAIRRNDYLYVGQKIRVI